MYVILIIPELLFILIVSFFGTIKMNSSYGIMKTTYTSIILIWMRLDFSQTSNKRLILRGGNC